MSAATPAARADYGLDAPGVLRNLLFFAVVGFIDFGSARVGLWPGILSFHVGDLALAFDFAGMGLGIGLVCLFMAGWMYWESHVGKLRSRDRLLDRHRWSGQEQVLDVGCGRGLLLIGAAHRLTSGRATGIDIWQSEDLSDNRADATEANARCEGVLERIELRTADMREMPFADASFDVIVSRAAIHNLYKKDERAAALREIVRVLKPGGEAIIEDIRHLGEYAAVFRASGCSDVTRHGSRVAALVLFLMSFTSLNPGLLVVRKP